MVLDELAHFRVRGTVLCTAVWAEGTHPGGPCQTSTRGSAFHRCTLVLGLNTR